MPPIHGNALPRGEVVTVTVNGKPVRAHRGASVHAALLAAGLRALRKSHRLYDPRGVFCGMGVCYECLVTINGQPNQRACMRLVEPDMEILTDAVDC
jgi:D-hydroxyproline dehydrogenase subunit gamma